MVSYLTAIMSNTVSLTVFEKFDAKILRPRCSKVQGYPRSKVTVQIDSPRVVSCSTSMTSLSYLSPFSAQATLHDDFDEL